MIDGTIRVLLADDHPLVRAGIRTTLDSEEDIAVVGEATDGEQARRLCQELKPEVVLLDLNMPGPPAAMTVSYLREQCPTVKILVLTAYDDEVYVRSMLAAGAAGYVLKDEAPDAVVRAIRTVMQGDTWYSRPVIERLAKIQDSGGDDGSRVVLTTREREIMAMIAQGSDNAEIAHALSLAEQTVRNYTSRIYLKLGITSRAQAVVWARERGLEKTRR